ncbi:MarR family transcriptional regulator [soil metagenome]
MSQPGDAWAPRTHAGTPVPWAWVRLLAVQGALTRRMDAHLRSGHDLTLRSYEVLLFLSWAPDRQLRRVELAGQLLLTQGGVTRLLSGLEADGLVEAVRSDADRRVVYARLTDAGLERLEQAAATHTADIRSMFTDRFSPDELATLAELLDRPGPDRADADD